MKIYLMTKWNGKYIKLYQAGKITTPAGQFYKLGAEQSSLTETLSKISKNQFWLVEK